MIDHGTAKGYGQHRTIGEQRCPDCTTAATTASRAPDLRQHQRRDEHHVGVAGRIDVDRPNVTILKGDARDLDLPDDSVDLIVTSPPYFGLRSYQDGGEHYAEQIGAEATPAEFVDALIDCTREWMRVVKPSGSIWVNLGDKYASGGRGAYDLDPGRREVAASRPRDGARPKTLLGIPWRYAIRCIDELGLILRAEVIWSKPNGLPESVTDRVRRSHEHWFCFQQDRSGSVVQGAEPLPLCKVCGLPVDARATLVARLKEVDGVVEPGRVPDEVGPDAGVQLEDAGGCHGDVAVSPSSAPVPPLEERHAEVVKGAADLPQDGLAAVVDGDSEDGSALPSDEGDRALSVDDSGQPSGVAVCQCESHAVIVDDEPWIPQSLAAELMQSVADGETDPQHVADFLSGDYARTHSTWFHFTLEPRYYSAVDEVREPHLAPGRSGTNPKHENAPFANGIPAHTSLSTTQPNPLGKLPGSVWTIPTEPLRVPEELGIDHFAAFPTEWPRRIIQGWSPRGVCVECGAGRRPVTKSLRTHSEAKGAARREASNAIGGGFISTLSDERNQPSAVITGEACDCPEPTAPTTPGVVLDPFGGTGTTALVASVLGRKGISNDMSSDYNRIAEWRTTDPKQRAKAARKPYTPPAEQTPGQLDLFDIGDAS